MEVAISAEHLELSPEVRGVVAEKVNRLTRFLEDAERAEVHFFEERNPRIADKEMCEVTLFARGRVVRARASAAEPVPALEAAAAKLTHRLTKLKERLVDRSHPRHRPAERELAADVDAAGDEDDNGVGRIVKTKRFELKPMTPEEAVLRMELLSHSFFFFANAESGRTAVVYRRDDGDVGLIDAS